MISKESYFTSNKFIYGGLFILALAIRLFIIQLDPFLHDWDERVHALVARSMMDYPLTPMLNKEFLSTFDFRDWVSNEIWVHKQPLFLWQIALSFKLFGISEFSLRLPSAIMGALSCPILYRITFLSFRNKRIALLTGLLWCFSYYQIELISAIIGMEHNDVAFSFYVLASIWALYEFIEKQSLRWAITIGVFAGCAILNKWLTGLLVFLPWGIYIIQDFIKNKKIVQLRSFALALLSCCIVFIPWQLYILSNYPTEAQHEYWLNSQHVITAVDGHAGEWYYYLLQFGRYFGGPLLLFIPFGFFTIVKNMNLFHWSNIVMGLSVIVFFSFLVQTKLPSFIFIIVPLFIMYLAAGFDRIISKLKLYNIYFILALPLCWFMLNPLQIRKNHFLPDANHDRKKANTIIYKALSPLLKERTHLVNMNTNDNIELMFYNPKIISAERNMPLDSIKFHLENGKNIAMFQNNIEAEIAEAFSKFDNFILLPFTPNLGPE